MFSVFHDISLYKVSTIRNLSNGNQPINNLSAAPPFSLRTSNPGIGPVRSKYPGGRGGNDLKGSENQTWKQTTLPLLRLFFWGGFIKQRPRHAWFTISSKFKPLLSLNRWPSEPEGIYDFSFIVHWKAYLCQPVTKVEKAVSTCTGDMLLVFCPKKGTLNGGCSVEVCRVLYFLSMRWVVSYHQGNPGVQDTYSRC